MMRWLLSLALALLIPGWAVAKTVGDEVKVGKGGLYSEPYLTIDPGAHTVSISQVSVDRAGRFVVTGSKDKTVRIWSASDGQLLRAIRVPSGPGNIGEVFEVAISPDGTMIAAGGYTGPYSGSVNLYLFDRATGTLLHRFGGLANTVTGIKFSSDGARLIVTLSVGGVRLYDVKQRRKIASDKAYDGSCNDVTFASDGRIATSSADGQIRLYSADLGLIHKAASFGGKRPSGVAFSPDGTRIAVAYFDTKNVDILNAETLVPLYAADTASLPNGAFYTIDWNADGTNLIAAGSAYSTKGEFFIRIWFQGGRGAFRDVPVSKNSILSIATLRDGRIAVATADPKLVMLDANVAPLWAVDPPIFDVRSMNLRVGADAAVVRYRPFGATLDLAFDVRARRLVGNPPEDASVQAARTTGIDIADWRNGFAPILEGKALALEKFERSNALAVASDNDSFLLGTDLSVRRYRADGSLLWRLSGGPHAFAVNQSNDGRLAVAAYDDGTIRWYRLADGKKMLTLFVHGDGERWVAWTPNGYYTASLGGEDLIRWVVNRGLDAAPKEYPVGAYRDKFYRPDVIANILDTLDINRAVQLADAARGRQTVAVATAVVVQQAPPVVTILDPADNSAVRKSPIEVAYRISGKPGERIKRLRALIDNRETVSQRDLMIPASGILDGTINVPVEGIAPLLQLYAANEFADSAPATVKLSGGIARQDVIKPVLYVLAIGISEYRNDARLKLNFADDDARAFVERMRAQKGGLYRDVIIRSLVDRDATTTAIRESLSWLQRQMSDGDVATVFVSAHGETDGRGDLYLISNDTDVRDEIIMRQTAVQWDDFDKDIKDLASRGKVLVFLDACKSGRVIPGKSVFPPDIDKAVNELRESGNDVTIFSSSTGTQLSREDEKLGQGYFTYALLEALDGKGVRSGAYVTTGDLNRYIAERVKKLTEGAQTPKVSTPLGSTSSPPLFVIR